MNEQVQQLEKTAVRCMHLALECSNAQARKMMRLLAADLILAADERRRANAATLEGELAALVRGNQSAAGREET
jgi:hypothetical protein